MRGRPDTRWRAGLPLLAAHLAVERASPRNHAARWCILRAEQTRATTPARNELVTRRQELNRHESLRQFALHVLAARLGPGIADQQARDRSASRSASHSRRCQHRSSHYTDHQRGCGNRRCDAHDEARTTSVSWNSTWQMVVRRASIITEQLHVTLHGLQSIHFDV
jgi:hypothetical protein